VTVSVTFAMRSPSANSTAGNDLRLVIAASPAIGDILFDPRCERFRLIRRALLQTKPRQEFGFRHRRTANHFDVANRRPRTRLDGERQDGAFGIVFQLGSRLNRRMAVAAFAQCVLEEARDPREPAERRRVAEAIGDDAAQRAFVDARAGGAGEADLRNRMDRHEIVAQRDPATLERRVHPHVLETPRPKRCVRLARTCSIDSGCPTTVSTIWVSIASLVSRPSTVSLTAAMDGDVILDRSVRTPRCGHTKDTKDTKATKTEERVRKCASRGTRARSFASPRCARESRTRGRLVVLEQYDLIVLHRVEAAGNVRYIRSEIRLPMVRRAVGFNRAVCCCNWYGSTSDGDNWKVSTRTSVPPPGRRRTTAAPRSPVWRARSGYRSASDSDSAGRAARRVGAPHLAEEQREHF